MHFRTERGWPLDISLPVLRRRRRHRVRGLGRNRFIAHRRDRRCFVCCRGYGRLCVGCDCRWRRRGFGGRGGFGLTGLQNLRSRRSGWRGRLGRHFGRRTSLGVGRRTQLPGNTNGQRQRGRNASGERPTGPTRRGTSLRDSSLRVRTRRARGIVRGAENRRVECRRRRRSVAVACKAVGQHTFFGRQWFAVGSVHGFNNVRSLSIA